MKIVSTFIPGAKEIIKRVLQKEKIEVDYIEDGLVVYNSENVEKVKGFRYFNNSFVLLQDFGKVGSVEEMIENTNYEFSNVKDLVKKNFKIFAFKENVPASVDKDALSKVESRIKSSCGVSVNIDRPYTEFVYSLRKNGKGYFMLKLTKAWKASKGELRPPVSSLLVFLSRPSKKDVFLDSFSGSGAIVKERVRHAHKRIVAVDKIKNSELKQHKAIESYKGDFLNIRFERYFNKVVSDPPWGHFEEVEEGFLDKAIKKIESILNNSGLCIFLLGRDQELNVPESMRIKEKQDVLVSGKKAKIVVLKKG